MELYKFIIVFLAVFITGIPVCSIAQTMNRPVPAQYNDSKLDNSKDADKPHKEIPKPLVKESPPPSQMRPNKPNPPPVSSQMRPNKPNPPPPPAKKTYYQAPKIKYTTVRHIYDVTPQNYYWYCYYTRYQYPHSRCELRPVTYSYYEVYRTNKNQSYYIPQIIKQDGKNHKDPPYHKR